jgi:hypothetical protein
MKLLDWCQERHVAQIEKGESTRCESSARPRSAQRCDRSTLTSMRLAQRCQPEFATLRLPPDHCDGSVSVQSTFVLSL